MGKYIRLLAAQMGKKIPVPITVTNYICLLASGGLGKSEKYLVDELQMMLSAMNVEAATVMRFWPISTNPVGITSSMNGIHFVTGLKVCLILR